MTGRRAPRWTDELSDEDLAFLRRFVLASGSLKDLAAAYGISYPTVRVRLDRLIAKVEMAGARAVGDPFERTIRRLQIDGRVDPHLAQELLSAHRQARAEEGERDGST